VTLAITTDQPTYSSGATATITVVRDATITPAPVAGASTTYTISFLETDETGATIDTGSIDLSVTAGSTPGSDTIVASSGDGLAITDVSDDGTTAVFSVVLP
jgi:hypothetical protein